MTAGADSAAGADAVSAYDVVDYISLAVPHTDPGHLATIATLHGLNPAPIHIARVLDIGGGDGLNVLAMAEALPDAAFLSIDLARVPVARGVSIAAAAGIANVRIEVADIVEAAATMEGQFDYVIAHGVYAWVPPPVQEALMALIARVLAPDGIAYVSYNALPGGYFRQMVRDMTLHVVGGITDPRERGTAARSFLTAFAEPHDNDDPPEAAARFIAARTATYPDGLLLHDELGEVYEPRTFTDVVAAGARHGLCYLNNDEPAQVGEGLPDEPLDGDELIRAIQTADYTHMRYFRKTLFVHADRAPRRTLALDRLRDLYLSARCERSGTIFKTAQKTVSIADEGLARAVTAASEAWPRRLRLGDLIEDEARLHAIYQLFTREIVGLHVAPFSGVDRAGSHPRAGALARTLLAGGRATVFTLDHHVLHLEEPASRALVALLDGTRDRAALAAAWAASGFAETLSLDEGLDRIARCSLLLA